jgi:predicted amidohydrolase YtcJ
MHPTILLTNARIYTQDADLPYARAVALAGNRILAVGDDLSHLVGPDTQTHDLGGRTVLPGFIDAHIHFVGWALQRRWVDTAGASSAAQALAAVAQKAGQTAPGRWLRGGGWDANIWPEGMPTRQMLDQVAPLHPVALDSKDWHSVWVNSLALARAGITASTPDPGDGVIERDPQTGEPTGILRENAVKLLDDVVAQPGLDESCAAAREGIHLAWANGLTGIHEASDTAEMLAFRTYQALLRRGELGLRVNQAIPRIRRQAAVELGLQSGFGSEWLRVGSVKFFADGALGSQTAWMLEPYLGRGDWHGVCTLDPEEFTEEALACSAAGLSVMIHAIGDRANRHVLDAFAVVRAAEPEWQADQALPARPWPPLRHRVEHVQIIHPDDAPRLAQLGLIASMQPIHATSDMLNADRVWGEPRVRGAYAWRTLLETGVALAFGSDAPIEAPDVLAGIHAAVTRRRADGTPGPDGWQPQERVSVAEAVRAYTLGAAFASGEEAIKGSIAPGKLADLVVLDRDLFTCAAEEILQTQVAATVLDGKVVYGELSA